MGLALKRSINRIARRLRLGSPRSILSNSVAAQLIDFLSYEIHSLPHCLLGLVYNEMGLNGDPIKYNVHQLDFTVGINSKVDLVDDILHHAPNAYEIIPTTLQKQLNNLANEYEEIADRAYDYWLSIMRWATDDYRIGRVGVSDNQSGWGARLKEPLSNQFVWIATRTLNSISIPAVTGEQWTTAAERLRLSAFRYTQLSDQRFSDFDGTAKLLICIGPAKAGHEKCELVSC